MDQLNEVAIHTVKAEETAKEVAKTMVDILKEEGINTDSESMSVKMDDVIYDASDKASSAANNGGLEGQIAHLLYLGHNPQYVLALCRENG